MSLHALVISDIEAITGPIAELLAGEGFTVHTASNGQTGLEVAQRCPLHLVVTGMVMPGLDGNEIIARVKGIDERTVVWVITEERNFNLDFAVRAMKLGADDYFVVFADMPLPKMRRSLQVLRERLELAQENARLQEQVRSGGLGGPALQGHSEGIRAVRRMIERVAGSDAAVLITGESGTGKEVVARMLWAASPRRSRGFVPINCGAIPEGLLESELFGHERGAFTGASQARVGRLEAARGGTVFLDEVGEMPTALQVKLLRFLQDGEVQRLGGARAVRVDARVISATNRDLAAEVAAGRFREDLFYRLDVVRIHLPPLRTRGADILLLANYFLCTFALQEGRQIWGFEAEALERLRAHPWPGNVRELRHRVHRAVILARRDRIGADDLGFSEPGSECSLTEAKARLEAGWVVEALSAHGGNVTRAAKQLGIARQQLQRYIRKHGVSPAAYRPVAPEP